MEDNPILGDRACGTCTLCCKLLGITELEKPRDQWCRHCKIGSGCTIYADRPPSCREFYCGYLTSPVLGSHWFPARSKMVVASEQEGDRIAIHVDPGRPDAWRQQPFYNEIKQWAKSAARDLRQIIVCVQNRSIVILPDDDVDLGAVADDERIVVSEILENGRPKLRAMKMHSSDPRLSGAHAGEIYNARTNP